MAYRHSDTHRLDLTVQTRSRHQTMVRHRCLEDETIASYLDDEWRTPTAVHRLLQERGESYKIAIALERLARAGKIENKYEGSMPKRGSPVCIDYYRRLQRLRISYYRRLQTA